MYPVSDFLNVPKGSYQGLPEALLIAAVFLSPIFIHHITLFLLRFTFMRYNIRGKNLGMQASELVTRHIYANELSTQVRIYPGELSDAYDNVNNRILLSSAVFYGTSPAAYAIALHELGHLLQHKDNYILIYIRDVFSSKVMPAGAIALVAGFIRFAAPDSVQNFSLFIKLGTFAFIFYLTMTIIIFITELDASRRARKMSKELDFTAEDRMQFNLVLKLAYMTYLISIISSLTWIALILMAKSDEEEPSKT